MTDSIVRPLRFYQIVLLIILSALCYFLVKDRLDINAHLHKSGPYSWRLSEEYKKKYPISS